MNCREGTFRQQGLCPTYALFASLMGGVLGYRRFGAQGGDWGAFVTARLGYAHPTKLTGIHMNLLTLRRDVKPPANPTAEEGACDPYQDDTACTQVRPLLCIYKPTPPSNCQPA